MAVWSHTFARPFLLLLKGFIMGFLFGTPKIKAPTVAEPEPVELADERPEEIRREEARKRRGRRGREKTFITGELAPGDIRKKKLLG
jgi:hypothetical protein